MSGKEYKFLGNTMENISIKYGIFLVVWAAIASIITQSESITSWIPAIIGFPIFFFGWLSRINPAKKKLFMHFSVSFGFLAFIGGLDFIRGIGSEVGPFANPYAGSSKLILLISGGLFSFLCVKSFRFARLNKN